jgi:putative ABC transport system permease protein
MVFRRVPLAWRNLTYDKTRLALSTSGVTFAVLLMLMQLGFRNALLDSQVELLRQLNCDLVLISPTKYRLYTKAPFPRRRLLQALAHDAITDAYPLYMEPLAASWRNPLDGETHPIRVLAFDPDEPVFLNPDIDRRREDLKMPDTVLLDERSKSILGPAKTGMESELASRNVRVVGTFRLGTDFAVDGNVVTSDRTFLALSKGGQASAPKLNRVEIGLLKVESGREPAAVRRSLRQQLPGDVKVLTKPELIRLERSYWLAYSPVGVIFNLAVGVSFVIGVVVSYQILFTSISDHLPQFATLRAIGHTNGRLVGVALRQAFYLALFGFVPGALVGNILYFAIAEFSGLKMQMTAHLLILVLILTISMCMLPGLLAARRAMTADPAEVY